MPRKAKKQEEPIDIVEIDYEHDQELPEDKMPEEAQSLRQPEGSASERKTPARSANNESKISEKRLEALARGREKARLNRLKKKEEEKAQLKEQLKQELLSQQPQREPSPEKKQKKDLQPSPQSESEEEQAPPPKQKHGVTLKEKESKKEPKQQPKQASKAEEQKKVLQKAKKNIPVFKEESKPKREARVRDFFKPKKVIEVSDSESD